MLPSKELFAITLFAEDLDATKEFYQRAFGLPIHFEGPTSAVFKFEGTLINLLKIEQADELIADEMCAELASRGVKLWIALGVSVQPVLWIRPVTFGKSPNKHI